MSKAAADAKRPRSPFLMPPAGSSGAGDDRYNLEDTDWSEIPTWRQTSFFGSAPGASSSSSSLTSREA